MSFHLFLRRLAMSSTVTVLLFCPRAFAQKLGHAPSIVTRNCSGCHGLVGSAPLPYIPRLAGQRAAYLERRIVAFRTAGTPPTDEIFHWKMMAYAIHKTMDKDSYAASHMVGMAHVVTPEDIQAATAWYASQKAAPGRAGNPELIEKGKTLFANGLPAQQIPPCQTCHGTQGEGTDRAPQLAGQNGNYLLSRLARFRAQDQQHASVMTLIAQHLDSDQSRAIAAYLQSR